MKPPEYIFFRWLCAMHWVRPILVLLLTLGFQLSFAQTDLLIAGNSESTTCLFVDSEAFIYVSGDYLDSTEVGDYADSKLYLSGVLKLGGDIIINQGSGSSMSPPFAPDSTYSNLRRIEFIGSGTQQIISDDTIHASGLFINKPAGDVILKAPYLSLYDTLELTSGGFDLQTNEIHLLTTFYRNSVLVGENSDNNIYGAGGRILSDYKVYDDGLAEPGGLGLQFESFDGNISCAVARVHFPRTDVANGAIGRYYEIFPDGEGNSKWIKNIRMEYHDAELEGMLAADLTGYYSEGAGLTWKNHHILNTTSPVVFADSIKIDTTSTLISLADSICQTPNQPNFNILASVFSDNSSITGGEFAGITNSFNVCELSDLSLQASVQNHPYYNWTFNDTNELAETDSIGFLEIPVDTTGEYNLFVRNSRGCELTKNLMVNVRSNPKTELSMTPNNVAGDKVCQPQEITFDGSESSVEGASIIQSYYWDFSDGTYDTTLVPTTTHTFPSENLYFPNLTVITDHLCVSLFVDEDTDTLTVIDPPLITNLFFQNNAFSTIDEICERDTVTFNAASKYADTTPRRDGSGNNDFDLSSNLFYDWDFDDGATLVDEARSDFSDTIHSFTYRDDNRFNVKVTARDVSLSHSCESTDSLYLIVHPLPTAQFTPKFLEDSTDVPGEVCEGVYLYMANSSYIRQGAYRPDFISGYWWDFGNGTYSTETEPIARYLQEGIYDIKLVAYSGEGCTGDTSVYTITINPAPDGVFGNDIYPDFDTICAGGSVQFTNGTTIPSGTVSYYWDFGDGTSSTDPSPAHIYTAPGKYPVSLQRTSDKGCSNLQTGLDVVVNAYPVASFEAADVCDTDAVQFNNTSFVPGPVVEVVYLWDFGDGNSSDVSNPIHQYMISSFEGKPDSSFRVSLTVTNYKSTSACSHVFEKTVTIHRNPTFDFGAAILSFGDTLLNPGNDAGSFLPSGTSFSWFNSYGQLLSNNETYLANQTGSYYVEIQTPESCDSVIDFPVYILDEVDLGGDQVFCESGSLNAAPSLSQVLQPVNYHFTHAGLTVQSGSNAKLSVSEEGWYAVEVSYEALGVAASTIDSVYVSIAELGSGDPACEPAIYPELDLEDSIATCYQSVLLDAEHIGATYLWSDGSTESTLLVTEDGTYWVTVTLANGNAESDTSIIYFRDSPIPDLGVDRQVCGEELLDPGVNAVSYLWSTGAVSSEIEVNQTGVYSVDIISSDGCINKDTVALQVNPLPVFDLGDDQFACDGELVTIGANIEGSYLWSTGQTSEQIEVSTADTYSLIVTSDMECSYEDSLLVYFNELPEIPLEDIESGCETVDLDAGDDGVSWLWSTGSAAQVLEVEESGYFWVKVTSVEGCINYDTIYVEINENPILNLPDSITACPGEEVVLSVGDQNEANAVVWSTKATSHSISIIGSGLFWVEVTSPDGCVSRDTTVVNFTSPISLDLGEDRAFCQSTTLDAGPDGSSYLWTSSNDKTWITQQISVDESGAYKVMVTTADGCTVSDSVQLYATTEILEASFLIPSEVTQGDFVYLVPLTEPEPDSYFWEFGDGVTSTMAMPYYQYSQTGEFTITLTVSNGVCEHSLSKTIKVNPPGARYALEDETVYQFVEILNTKIYPDPVTNEEMTLAIDLTYESPAIITIYDFQGHLVFSHEYSLSTENELCFDLNGLREGMYMVCLQVGKATQMDRFVKIQ